MATNIPNDVRRWLLATSESTARTAWRIVRDDLICDWLAANADRIVLSRRLIREARAECGRAMPTIDVSLAAFMRAKKVVFPQGWCGPRGRMSQADAELDVEGQVLLPMEELK